MTRLVVTGASGYVGGRLVAKASALDGVEVVAVVRAGGHSLPLPVVEVETLEKDAEHAVRGADAVIHLAGQNEVAFAADPHRAFDSTISASRAVARACAAQHVKRLVYLSTVHVYGAALQPGAVVNEDTLPRPCSPYAVARLASEHIIPIFAGETQVVVLRLTNGIGPPARPDVDRWTLVANDLCRQAVCKHALTLLTSGQQYRDFVALDDVDSILLNSALDFVLPSGTYNLGSGRSTSILELAQMIVEEAVALGMEAPSLNVPSPTEPAPMPYDISVKLLADIGLHSSTPIAKALSDTLLFCLEYRAQLCA